MDNVCWDFCSSYSPEYSPAYKRDRSTQGLNGMHNKVIQDPECYVLAIKCVKNIMSLLPKENMPYQLMQEY